MPNHSQSRSTTPSSMARAHLKVVQRMKLMPSISPVHHRSPAASYWPVQVWNWIVYLPGEILSQLGFLFGRQVGAYQLHMCAFEGILHFVYCGIRGK